jgi:predicted nucleic acid-binding protein
MPLVPPLAETTLVVDTDVFTHWRNRHPYVLERVAGYFKRLKEFPALTSMTVFEAISGIERELVRGKIAHEQANQYHARIEQLGASMTQLAFDKTSATIAAYIYQRLAQSERNKHWRDIFIAATALGNGYGIATTNRRDFELIAAHLPNSNPILRLAVWKQ